MPGLQSVCDMFSTGFLPSFSFFFSFFSLSSSPLPWCADEPEAPMCVPGVRLIVTLDLSDYKKNEFSYPLLVSEQGPPPAATTTEGALPKAPVLPKRGFDLAGLAARWVTQKKKKKKKIRKRGKRGKKRRRKKRRLDRSCLSLSNCFCLDFLLHPHLARKTGSFAASQTTSQSSSKRRKTDDVR